MRITAGLCYNNEVHRKRKDARLNARILTVFSIALSLAGTSAASAQTVYRWTDADGVVHYGTWAPDGVDATLVNTTSAFGGIGVSAEEVSPTDPQAGAEGEDPELSYAEQRRQERAQRRADAMQENAEREAQCAAMRRQRDALEPSPRVIIKDADGNPVRMSDEDRLAGIEEARQYLSENCR